MKYYSTNRKASEVSLKEAVIKGLAPDKGLYMPEYLPELPKAFFDNIANMSLQEMSSVVAEALFGDGILVAVLDSGIDYANSDFRNEDGSTRIYRLWDQTIAGNPPEGYAFGSEYTKEIF